LKRSFDIFGAAIVLLVTAPLLAAISVAVLLSSGRPVLFRHRRVGKEGRAFLCLKFRTMVVDAETWLSRDDALSARHRAAGFKLPVREDPRVTPVGRLLRRTQLDELPQLWNVVVGEMSLVGPRPLVSEELVWFDEDEQRRLLSVRPGIFGPWTARGRGRPGYPERAKLDLSYVSRAGLKEDLRLLAAHVPVLLSGQSDDC
jgi:lipopolysaccharide/colanic/teichoic acid biosynthesis glycosyltransferase